MTGRRDLANIPVSAHAQYEDLVNAPGDEELEWHYKVEYMTERQLYRRYRTSAEYNERYGLPDAKSEAIFSLIDALLNMANDRRTN